MVEVKQLSYAAVITLSLPGTEKPLTATVTLTPLDTIPTSSGRVKPLTECTLADLQAFADQLEQQLWADHQAIKLADLAQNEDGQIKITIINEGEPLEKTDWQQQAVVLTNPKSEIAAPAVEPKPEPKPAVADPPKKQPEIRIAGLRRPVGHSTPTAVDILINETAFREAQAHSLTSLDREVAGMLIGPQPEKQPDGRYVVHISDIVIAKHTRMQGASVTYTPESWRHVHDVLQERYPNEEAVIVGWYHTHPGFGIFLSGMDLFIHQNFFTQKWHVALVLDPQAHKSGFFCWDRAQTKVSPYDFPWPSWAANSW